MERDRTAAPRRGRDSALRRFPDDVYYSRVAHATGFPASALERVFRLVTLLQAVSERLGMEVSLRGGTALNLIHLDVPRLSVDIDLDFVGAPDAQDARARREPLMEELASVGRSLGYRAVPERPSYAMGHLRMEYTDTRGRPAYVKLDVNFLDRVPVLPPETLPLRHPFGDDVAPFTVRTLALPELAAAKVVALCRRRLARDLFDTAALHTLSSLDLGLVRPILVVRGAGYPPPSPLEYDVTCGDGIRELAWNAEVVALVRRPAPFTLEDARARACELLTEVLALSDAQRLFLDRLGRGELRADLLGLDAARARIEANPGLNWRLRQGAAGLEER